MANRNNTNGGTVKGAPVSSNKKQTNVLTVHSSLPKSEKSTTTQSQKVSNQAVKGLRSEMETYHKYSQAAKSRGNMDMGVENTDKTKADQEKQRLMKTYKVSERQFDDIYKSYSSRKKEEAVQATVDKTKKEAEKSPVKATLKSLGTNLASGIEGIANTIGLIQEGAQENLYNKKKEFENSKEYNDNSLKTKVKKALYEGVDDVAPANRIRSYKDYVANDVTNALREGAKSNIKSNAGKTAYDIGTSAADMGTQALIGALTGGAGTAMGVLQGGQIANSMSKESLDRQNSALQSGLTGLGAGAVTAGLTKVGMDDVTKGIGKILEKQGIEGAAKNTLGKAVLKGILNEGIEEGAENIADKYIENKLNDKFRGTSSKSDAILNYRMQGMSKEQAEAQYKKDRAAEVLQDAAVGGLFGGLFGAGNVAVENAIGKMNPTVDSLFTKNKANTNNNTDIPSNNIERVNGEVVDGVIKNGLPSVRSNGEMQAVNDYVNDIVPYNADPSMIEGKNQLGIEEKPGEPIPMTGTQGVINLGTNLDTEEVYNNLNRENLGTGINRSDKENEIFRTSKKPWQGGAKQLMDNVLSMAWGREGMAENKELRLKFNKAFKDFVEQGNNESYTNMMNLANEIMAKLPEENPVYPSGTRSEFEAQLNYVLNRPEINNNMTIEDMWSVVRDPNTSIEEKQNKILDVINNWKGEEQHDKYIPEIENAMNFVRELQAAQDKYNPRVETEPTVDNTPIETESNVNNAPNKTPVIPENLGLTLNENVETPKNNNSFVTPNGNTFTLEEEIETGRDYTPNFTMSDVPNRATVNEDIRQNFEEKPLGNENVTNDGTYEPQEGDGQERHRSYTISMDMPEDFKFEFANDVYNQLSNKKTLETAEEILNGSKSLREAESKFREMLGRKDAASVPLGYEIARQYLDIGEHNAAVDIINDISQEMTRAGQFTQAAYITALRSDPIAVMASTFKDLDKINKQGREKFGKQWKDFQLTPEEQQAFANIEKGDTEAITQLTNDIYNRMSKDMPHKKWDQFYDITKHCMLLNPRTHIRNMVANAVTMPVRSMTDRVKYVLEGMYGMVNKDYERTSSLKGGNKERKAIASKYFDDYVKNKIDDGGKYQESGLGRLEKESQLFDNTKIGEKLREPTQKLANGGYTLVNALNRLTGGKLNEKTGILDNVEDFKDNKITGSVLENIRQLDYWLLGDVEDVPFVKQNFVNALSNYMEAQKINDPDKIPPEAVSIALDEALKATFKDDNAFTKALSGVKKHTGKFGQMVMPFTKTPANLAMRGIDYSPVGFINTFNNALKTKKAQNGKLTNADISKVIGELSKNVTGTGLIFLGYELAKKGLITGDYSEDKNEKNFQKMQGFQPNAFHVGNKYYTYDWSQPSSIPLIIGTSIYEGIQRDDAETNQAMQIANSIKNGFVNSADAWFNLSPLKGVAEVFGGGDNASYGDNSITENMLNVVTEYPQTLIPSVVGATARAKDPVIRNTYDKTSGLNTYINKAKAKIPGLSKELPASYDTWGRERKRSANSKDATFAQFINPGTLGYENRSEVDDYVESIFNATQNSQAFPDQADYNIDGRKLNNKEYSERQKMQGQTSLKLVKAFEKVAKNSDLTPEEQADALDKIYKAAKQDTNNTLYDKDYSMGKTEYEKYSQGAKVYAEYLRDYALAKRNGKTYDKYMKTISGEGEEDTKKLEKAAEVQSATNEIKEKTGNTVRSDTYKYLTDKGASKEDVVFLTELKKNTKNNAEVLNYLGKQNISDAERSRYIKLNASKGDLDKKYVQRGVEQFGESAYYQIFLNKSNADLDHNGSLKNDEARTYVDKTYKTASERAKWYKVLTGKDY